MGVFGHICGEALGALGERYVNFAKPNTIEKIAYVLCRWHSRGGRGSNGRLTF